MMLQKRVSSSVGHEMFGFVLVCFVAVFLLSSSLASGWLENLTY